MSIKEHRLPKGWDESPTEDEVTAKDEATWENSSQTYMKTPNDLVSAVRELIANKAEEAANNTAQKMTRHSS